MCVLCMCNTYLCKLDSRTLEQKLGKSKLIWDRSSAHSTHFLPASKTQGAFRSHQFVWYHVCTFMDTFKSSMDVYIYVPQVANSEY